MKDGTIRTAKCRVYQVVSLAVSAALPPPSQALPLLPLTLLPTWREESRRRVDPPLSKPTRKTAKTRELNVVVTQAQSVLQQSVFPTAAMTTLLLLLPLLLQLAAQGAATTCPPPGLVKIESLSCAGSGCPPGTAFGYISNDGQALTVAFSKFYASTDELLAARRHSCVVRVKLSYPEEFFVSVGTVTTSGYMQLDAGTVATIQTWYYFSGLPGTARFVRNFTGEVEEHFKVTDKFLTLIYSSCGVSRDLILGLEARLTPGPGYPSEGNGFVGSGSVDCYFNQVWNLVWGKC
ncbi:hypothetical protein CBR_g31628 [Chara braunii]|uniref:DUF4360 domain-containing protein n=1 Tax=Chara braunii TaxID=69332 RepID=A0A388LFJ4_CHABU|nr:hypothetical protein CBR_g31628 [Chara braunii]|eukprot:GBG81071.1 hypothetical protein CBR_g31628 [Chara braunii]